jgi:SAM-dependent methyltransferase
MRRGALSWSVAFDSRLAAIYDALNPPGPDDAFYAELAGNRPRAILDVGCGTGWLACDLAALGHSVTGVDLSDAMLEIARHRPGGERVKWIKGRATELSLEHRFDLIIMMGHAFQVLLRDRDFLVALRTLRDHLAPAGQLAFETRNRATDCSENCNVSSPDGIVKGWSRDQWPAVQQRAKEISAKLDAGKWDELGLGRWARRPHLTKVPLH